MQSFIPAEIPSQLEQIRDRLSNADIGTLVQNAGPIRARFSEVEHVLPEALVTAIQPAAFLEFLRFDYLRAERNIADRASRRQPQSATEPATKKSEDELAKLGTLEAQAINSQNRIGQIRTEIEALEILLTSKKQDLQSAEANLVVINKKIQAQEGILAAEASALEAAWWQVQQIGDDEGDMCVFANIDTVRTRAIDAINAFL